jgi:hypothetical protein
MRDEFYKNGCKTLNLAYGTFRAYWDMVVNPFTAKWETLQGIYPWTLENGMVTVIHLRNTTNEVQTVGVAVPYAGGTYVPDRFDLQPYQTIAVDVKKLKVSKQPDHQGHLIPSDATRG